MKKIIIDLENKDEGPLHSFAKQFIHYRLTTCEGKYELWGESDWSTSERNILGCMTYEQLKEKEIYTEYSALYDGKIRIPDITALDKNKKPETVIEIVDSNYINHEKIMNYFNEKVNIVCVFINTDLTSLKTFYGLNYYCIKRDEDEYVKTAKAIKLFFKFKKYLNNHEIAIKFHREKGYMIYLKKDKEEKKWFPYSGTKKCTPQSKDRNKYLEILCKNFVMQYEEHQKHRKTNGYTIFNLEMKCKHPKDKGWHLPL